MSQLPSEAKQSPHFTRGEQAMIELPGYSLREFASISESASPRAAISTLGPREFGVIADAEGLPIGLVSQYDLKRMHDRGLNSLADPSAGLPPTVVAAEEVRLTDLLDIDVLPVFSIGARGVILVSEDRQAVAVLPIQQIIQYLNDRTDNIRSEEGESQADTREGSATFRKKFISISWGPAAGHPVPSDDGGGILPVIVVRCAQCGQVNRMACLDPDAPPKCESAAQPEHRLKLPQKCASQLPFGF